ncbi:unnamed protein product [Polarella glacialis]|uniref:D-glutamate cyclase-like C-terminal domain-containing protein n=1 Tax=Polarella glacialis TaxID=89957 RepID=A0A813IKE4_POLGL|nr:unnamed protein product [Polarella glacialis]
MSWLLSTSSFRDPASLQLGSSIRFMEDAGAAKLLTVEALELAITHNEADLMAYKLRKQELGEPLSSFCRGYEFSGSSAGRNIELIYQKATAAGSKCGLASAVQACFQSGTAVKHVLICSGFFVAHDRAGAPSPGLAAGSCETDGPLGALALLRAFASRGVLVSLFCDAHTGPVIAAGYAAMMDHFVQTDGQMAETLRQFSRCLPLVTDRPVLREDISALQQLLLEAFPGADGQLDSSPARCARLVLNLKKSLQLAWGEGLCEIDCLFAIERLGAPYRNIRGQDKSSQTEPIDCLWPLADLVLPAGLSAQAVAAATAYAAENKIVASTVAVLRRAAGVTPDAVTLGIGDGGNEVGMGRVVLLESMADMRPDGDEFAAMSVNGCYRSCDHLIVATVSNWAGNAFELAAEVLLGPSARVPYLGRLALADLEQKLLKAIMASPFPSAVDGKYPELPDSVDGMSFEACHRPLYDLLVELSRS